MPVLIRTPEAGVSPHFTMEMIITIGAQQSVRALGNKIRRPIDGLETPHLTGRASSTGHAEWRFHLWTERKWMEEGVVGVVWKREVIGVEVRLVEATREDG